MSYVDPPEPPEARERMNAKNLKGSFLVLRPTELGEWPAKAAETDENGNVRAAQKAQPFIACDVWVFDRVGITEQDTGIRFTWWRAVEQLRDQIGQLVACRPLEQDDRSVVLVPLTGDARKVAEKVCAEILGADTPADLDDDERPF